MQNDCKNSKSSEKFEVLSKKITISDELKAELAEYFKENRLSEVVNTVVGGFNINDIHTGKLKTEAFTIDEVNEMIDCGKIGEIVSIFENVKEAGISSIAEDIAQKCPKIVLIAGPSSSGKTTFCKKTAYALQQQGLHPIMLSLDDYYRSLDETPLDENGEYDFESLYALDLELFQNHLTDLIAGKEVFLPRYNFTNAKREWADSPTIMDKDTILIIEGIHGLNPELTGNIDKNLLYRVYISGSALKIGKNGKHFLCTDNRLIRRMVRDYKYRGTSAQNTIGRWNSVRKGEQTWIVPYQKYANANINTAYPYEIGLMREEVIPLLEAVKQDEPAYHEAQRILGLAREVHAIPTRVLPKYSILREFVGGSGYEY